MGRETLGLKYPGTPAKFEVRGEDFFYNNLIINLVTVLLNSNFSYVFRHEISLAILIPNLIIQTWACFIAFGTTCYLSAIWFWLNWVMHKSARHFIHTKVEKPGLKRESFKPIGEGLAKMLDMMDAVSDDWKHFHIFRALLALLDAAACLGLSLIFAMGESSDESMDRRVVRFANLSWLIAAALLFFIVIFLNALAPGAVNDKLFDTMQTKLFNIAFTSPQSGYDPNLISSADIDSGKDDKSNRGSGQRDSVQTEEVQRIASMMMQGIESLQGRRGMHFGGVPMTTAQSLTVGSVLSYAA
eukprot:CAMPEP_0170193766 /NCGR_PEP_ID=MMETSP0040_2-20121228/57680_1 /TAXON_ID=641309 /ORGANISM="Lotharella oceanica, Strain CCMP622" /LENGTH=299 /DNA_ID=CAMNT_0010442491 /DNA_START=214 /DNA_END=1111 /DNA_ORIENTATION=-